MKENNLDKLFREKLTDFQELPDEKVWRSIEASLEKKKQSRQILPIWWKAAGIAAVLAILFFAIDPFATPDMGDPTITDIENKAADKINDLENPDTIKETFSEPSGITATEEKTKKEPQTKPGHSNQGIIAHPLSNQNPTGTLAAKGNRNETDPSSKITEIAAFVPQKDNLPVSGTDPDLVDNKKEPNETTRVKNGLPNFMEDKIVDGGNDTEQEEDSQIVGGIDENTNKKSILDEIEKQQLEEEKIVEASSGKWSAGPSIAPVYFDGIGKGSPINPMLDNNSKSGNVTLSYGINVAYEVSKKVSIRSGIHKVDFGYNTNDVSFTSSFNALSGGQLKNIDYNNTAQSIIIEGMGSLNSIPRPNSPSVANDVMAKNPARTGTMGQQIGYLEVPLEVNYAVLDRKFGIDLIGGLSSLFLTDNSVVLQSSGKTTELGEANNINTVNFSTNVGLGLNYKFTDRLKLNVEPVFKYQLNTFNDTSGGFNPYSFGVYSGFSFKF